MDSIISSISWAHSNTFDLCHGGRSNRQAGDAVSAWSISSEITYMVSGCNPILEYTNFHERVFQILRDQIPSLKLTAKAPENGWLEYEYGRFLGVKDLFSRGYVIVFRAGARDVSRNQWWKHVHNTAGGLTKKQFEV